MNFTSSGFQAFDSNSNSYHNNILQTEGPEVNRANDMRLDSGISPMHMTMRVSYQEPIRRQNTTQVQSQQKDYKSYIKEQAPKAISRLTFLGRNVISGLGLFSGA